MVTRKVEAEKEDTEKKERVIHTRVPESLEAELRERAQDLGISVSNLVRNVLGHAFGLVGDIAADANAIARAARGKHGAGVAPSPPPATPTELVSDVIGWQTIALGKNAICTRCNDILPRGRDAALGITEHGGARVIICTPCLAEVRQ